MKNWLNLIYSLVFGLLLMTSVSSCGNAEAQQAPLDSSGQASESYRHPGPDGNPATFDQDPENLPQSPLWTYINADGREVQNPTGYKEIPADASAICQNGEYSFSKRRCGTCSGNGGVKEWLKDLPACN